MTTTATQTGNGTTATPAAAATNTAAPVTGEAGKTSAAPVVETSSTKAPDEGSKATTKGTDGSGESTKTEAAKAPADSSDYSIKVPDGVVADPAELTEFTAIAKEIGLKPEHAQKLVDFNVKLNQARERALAEQREAALETLKKEFPGEKLTTAKQQAEKFLAKEASPGLLELLKGPLGDHPDFFRFCVSMAKRNAEDSVAGDQGSKSGPPNTEEAFLRRQFPSMFKE